LIQKENNITSTVTWQQNGQRTGIVTLRYLLNILERDCGQRRNAGLQRRQDHQRCHEIPSLRANSTWGPVSNMADVDPTTTNQALRTLRLYSSPTRMKKLRSPVTTMAQLNWFMLKFMMAPLGVMFNYLQVGRNNLFMTI